MLHLSEGTLLFLARVVAVTRLGISRLEVTEHQVVVPDLPPALEGYTIAQVSDLHLGPGAWAPPHLHRALEEISRAGPDVLVNTGDYVQWEPNGAQVAADAVPWPAVAQGRERVPAVTILGNHDYYPGESYAGKLARRLRESGYIVLENEAVTLGEGERKISFVGLSRDAPNLERGILALLAAPHPRIALVHEPDAVEALPARSADLVLCGHTHGGQVTWPGWELRIVQRFAKSNYVEGFYRVNGMTVYVNRGLGTTGVPVRFRARPEVTMLRLVR